MSSAPKGGHHLLVAITAICLVLGALLGMQVHTRVVLGETEVGRRTNAVISMLSSTRAELEQQRNETEQLRTQISEKGLAKLGDEQLRATRIAAGLSSVKGPGIELLLNDSTMNLGDASDDQGYLVIHDYDLIKIANELWAAGAEAVSLNGQRLVTGSAITCSGRVIQVNGARVAAPFTFLAIGSQQNLVSALNIRGGALDELRRLEFVVELTPKDEVVVGGLGITPKYQYATPVKPEKGQ